MKNFPHQFARLDKLSNALRTAALLIDDGADFHRNSIFGRQLAVDGVYTFRGDGSVEQKLQEESQKPQSRRGTETAAREMRRFLLLSGFIGETDDGTSFNISKTGRELLDSKSDALRMSLWRESMLTLELKDEAGSVSHPYRLLVRLVTEFPGMETSKLLLALEARDDSEEEYQRIVELVALTFDEIVAALGIGQSNAKNAVKVLPSIAHQIGDIERKANQSHPRSTTAVTEDAIEPLPAIPALAHSVAHAPTPLANAVSAEDIASTPEFSEKSLHPFDLSAAIELRNKRTILHQKIVRSFASLLESLKFSLFEYPYDCLARKDDFVVLAEVKTLDGTVSDERKQAVRALGQIRSYAYFNVPEDFKGGQMELVVAFSEKPTEPILDFLAEQGISTAWIENTADWQLFRSADGMTNITGETFG